MVSLGDAMDISETEALIKGKPDDDDDIGRMTPILRPRLKKYKTRFWIIFSFALIGMCQCMNCFTLTSLPDSSEKYFNITQSELIVIFNWQPLANTVGALFAAGCTRPSGQRPPSGCWRCSPWRDRPFVASPRLCPPC